MSACPGRAEIEELLAGRLSPDRADHLERHLSDCRDCQRALDTLCDLETLLPGGPGPQCRRLSSDGLNRVMDELRAAPPVPNKLPAADSAPPRTALPFLRPTDRPGFLGRLGPYDIRREIGRGGMGLVFEGFDPALKRTVAIKILSPLGVTEEARSRFIREAQAAAALEHEHIVTIHAVDQVHDVPFIVMQHVAGESLADRLAREGPLPFADVLRIGAQVARGLVAAHAKGLIHRDIKPANILLEAGTGRAKIADFGLAKAAGDGSLTATGTVAGTPEFMSPEQALGGARGDVVDARSDLFSLGVVLYAMCSGGSPFRTDSPLLTLERVRWEQPDTLKRVDLALPDWFCGVVQQLLAKDPADRITSAAELAAVLEQTRAAPTLAIHTTPPATVTIALPPRRPLRPWWTAGGLALVGLVLAGVLYANRTRPENEPPAPAPPPQPESQAQPEPLRPAPSGIAVVGKPETYRTLDEAIAAAGDDTVIEIHGDGPFLTPPLRTGGKRLTIRAGSGQPVFVKEQPTLRAKQPFITADADLRLEGLEIHWGMEASPGWTETELLGRSVVVSTAGKLTLSHCRVVTGRANNCVGASGGEVVLGHSHFLTGDLGFCVYCRPSPGGLRAEGCQFEGRCALSVSAVAKIGSARPAPVHLERNTFATEKTLNLQMAEGPRQALRVTARRNLFNSSELVVLFAVRPLGKMEPPRPETMIATLRGLVEWSEEANVYRRGSQFLVGGGAKSGSKMLSAQIDALAQWAELWTFPPTASAEGTIRFADRKYATDPLQVLTVDDRPVPASVAGASADQLGPGAAGHDARKK